MSNDDIKAFFAKHRKSGKKDKAISEMLKKSIIDELEDAVKNNRIPGVLGGQKMMPTPTEDLIPNIPIINRIIMVIFNRLAEKKCDKMTRCYIINTLVNLLNLTEEDFEKFHEKMSGLNGEEPPE